MPLPVTVTYSDANKPDWIAVIKENPDLDFTLQITLETYSSIKFVTSNIEGLLIDLPKAIADTGLSVADVQAIIAFIRFTAPKLTLTLDGTGIDNYEIILPPGLSVIQVRKATGERIPFFFNMARNSVVFTVVFSSTEVIELLVASVTNMLNRALQSITTVMVLTSVLQTIFGELGKIVQEVRQKI
jgi:hypothetical protein